MSHIRNEAKLVSDSFGINLTGREMLVLYALVGLSTPTDINTKLTRLGVVFRVGDSSDNKDTLLGLYSKMEALLKYHEVI